MGSDIARRTYDASRQYRRVVAQQGRAIIEADLNEAQEILTEETRKEALDFVGPYGTPDNGYEVTFQSPPDDIHIAPGTMYVGGMRVELPGVFYLQQKERVELPLGIRLVQNRQLLCLVLMEREVSAVEDRPLREVALGGPDTAQRTRLLQQVIPFYLDDEAHCEEAFNTVQEQLAAVGLDFNEKTAQLESTARLLAKFDLPSPAADPCSPVTQAGYLGAENQLIRVQVSASNKLLWGYDNASFLYRIKRATVDSATQRTVIELASSPVDAHHEPRVGQWVEVLLPAADLGEKNIVAALSGLPVQVTAQYDHAKRTFEIGMAFSQSLLNYIVGSALFIRVWEEQLEFTAGTALALGETGLSVTLTAQDNLFGAGDYWMVALRPAAPTQIFPQRYENAPQPPEGPRRWICPLALVDTSLGHYEVLHDCREHFDNLVELTRRRGCCTITVSPQDVMGGAGLQALIDRITSMRAPGTKVSICLMPGEYALEETLRLGGDPQKSHNDLEITSCIPGGAVIKAKTGCTKFIDGLVAIVDAVSVTLRGIKFVLPKICFDAEGGMYGCYTSQNLYDNSSGAISLSSLHVGIGIRVVGSFVAPFGAAEAFCRDIRIVECMFDYDILAARSTDVRFGAGVFLSGSVRGLEVLENQFVSNGDEAGQQSLYLYGYIHTWSTQFLTPSFTLPDIRLVNAWVDKAVIRGNRFRNLTAAVLSAGEHGQIRAEANDVESGCAGLWFVSSLVLFVSQPQGVLAEMLENDCFVGGAALARAYPLPAGVVLAPPVQVPVTLNWISLQQLLFSVEAIALAQSTFVPVTLHIGSNDVHCGDGAALLVMAPEATTVKNHILVHANRLNANNPLFSAGLWVLARSSVTGNVVINESEEEESRSLIIASNEPRAAITGNVFRPEPSLPARPPQVPPIPDVQWEFFNYVET